MSLLTAPIVKKRLEFTLSLRKRPKTNCSLLILNFDLSKRLEKQLPSKANLRTLLI